ncbi:MAG: aminoacyl-tRNA hydrolase [Gammaproteobacteria bacterium]|nr:aminoacyl-tRNA hydrolase [Gammaproteobacteria bacterium]
MALITIAPGVCIDDGAFEFNFIRASGPGGQNVNKVATAVQLRYDTTALPTDVQRRLPGFAGKRLTADGMLIIDARRHRTQERNRADAVERLLDVLRLAAEKPKLRIKTKPTKASKQRRHDAKRERGSLKRVRRTRIEHDE